MAHQDLITLDGAFKMSIEAGSRTRESTPHQLLPIPIALVADHELQKQTKHMQSCWDRAVCKELEVVDRYTKVAVLIIHWVAELDTDLGCGQEVCRLPTPQLTEADCSQGCGTR